MRRFHFLAGMGEIVTGPKLAARARQAEELGYHAVVVPDHLLDQLSPVVTMATVAAATTTLRVSAFVLNNDLRHPAVLAQDLASLDVLSGGRLDVAIGAGWNRAEYDSIGVAFDPTGVRQARLAESIAVLKGLFSGSAFSFVGDYYTISNYAARPVPVQRQHPPVLIGGGGRRTLSLGSRRGMTQFFASWAKVDAPAHLPEGGHVSGWVLPMVGVLLIGYGAVSARLQTSVVSEAMVFVVAGLVIGIGAFHLVDLGPASGVVLFLAEATLAVVLFTDAVRVKLPRLRHEAAVPLRLLGIGLPLTIGAGTVIGLLLFPNLNVWTAAALATVLAPTDAALGLPVISNQKLPSRIRQGLNVESGLNDGVCVPLLIIFLTVAAAEEDTVQMGPLQILLEEIGLGALAGIAAGILGGWVLRQTIERGWATPGWQQIISVATAVLAYTVAVALGGSGFIASFVAGITFAMVAGAVAESSTGFAEQSGLLLNALTFLMFGAVLLGPALGVLDWSVVLYAVLSLTVVRMVPVTLAMLGMRMRPSTVAFLGWFGPRGLASIVFVLLVVDEGSLAESALLQTVVSITVGLSVFAHGMSAYPLARAYASWFAGQSTEHPAMSENTPVRAPRHRAERVGAGGDGGNP